MNVRVPVTASSLLGLTLLAGFSSPRLAAQEPTFKSGTQVVSLFATVTDANKRLVPSLEKADFEVLDNEKPQPLVFFQNEVQPITVIPMLDTSGSMTGSIDLLRAAARDPRSRQAPRSFLCTSPSQTRRSGSCRTS